MSVDEGPTVPAPDAGVFGRVPLKGTLPFFPLVLTGVSTSLSLKML
jgi:hypothetical protein